MDILKDIEYILRLDNTEWIFDKKCLVKILNNLNSYRESRLLEKIKYALLERGKFENETEISDVLKNIENKQDSMAFENEIFSSWYDIISESLWNDEIKIDGKSVIEKLDNIAFAPSGEIIDRNVEFNIYYENNKESIIIDDKYKADEFSIGVYAFKRNDKTIDIYAKWAAINLMKLDKEGTGQWRNDNIVVPNLFFEYENKDGKLNVIQLGKAYHSSVEEWCFDDISKLDKNILFERFYSYKMN